MLKEQGYNQGQTDHTMFTKHSPSGKLAVLIVYVDDIVLTGDFEGEIPRIKEFL